MFNNLKKLHRLNSHIDYVKDKSGYENIFIVGGSIRDTILGKEEPINDIDITGPFHPNDFREKISKKDFSNEISIFRTEKYGTMTIIPKKTEKSDKSEKNQKKESTDLIDLSKSLSDSSNLSVQYETTPFRTEGEYTDNRRPDEVTWSDSLLEDAKRRDFTINCMYYYKTGNPTLNPSPKQGGKQTGCTPPPTPPRNREGRSAGSASPSSQEGDGGGGMFNQDKIFTELKNKGIYFFPTTHICIIQSHKIIEDLFQKTSKKDFFNKKYFQTLVKRFTGGTDTNRGILIDPYLGLQSLKNKKLTAVGDPDLRIKEDALRIIRALRFSQILFFDFDKHLRNSLKKNFFRVKTLPKERIKIEIDKVSKKGSLFGFVSICDEINILKTLFPALHQTKGIEQPVKYHPFDIYAHTMLVLWHLEKLMKNYDLPTQKNYLVKRSALYHDVGKVDQYYSYTLFSDKDECNKNKELNHRNSSGPMMIDDFQKLGFSKKELTEIKWYIDNHHKTYENVINSKTSSHKKKLRMLYSEGGYERTKNLLLLTQADILGQYNPIQTDNILLTNYLFDILDELKDEEGQFTMKSLIVNGNWLMENFKLKPGKQLGKLLKQVFERVMNDVQERNNINQITIYTKSLIKNTNK